MRGHTEVAQLLLAAGADIHAVALDGLTPLHDAAWQGKLQMVQLLLQEGAEPELREANDHTAFHTAAYFGHKDIVQLLLGPGGQQRITAGDLETAVQDAARMNHTPTAARLVKELRLRHPNEFKRVFQSFVPILPGPIMAAVLDEWTSDVSSLDKQRAAVRKQEQDVLSDKKGVQQLILGVAGAAKQKQAAQQPHKTVQQQPTEGLLQEPQEETKQEPLQPSCAVVEPHEVTHETTQLQPHEASQEQPQNVSKMGSVDITLDNN
jgi:hypothetical protein